MKNSFIQLKVRYTSQGFDKGLEKCIQYTSMTKERSHDHQKENKGYLVIHKEHKGIRIVTEPIGALNLK